MTLSITGAAGGGKPLSLEAPLELSYEADRSVPCDGLAFSVPLQHEGEIFETMSVSLGAGPIFSGIVDRQVVEKSERGRLLHFECRSRAAYLLDNEAKPCAYFQVTGQQIFERYAAPFGIRGTAFPSGAKLPFFQVRKGASCWQVIEQFCLAACRQKPYLNRDGLLVLRPLTGKSHLLSNRAGKGTRYSAITVQRRNDKLLSRLYLKTATEAGGYFYGVTLDNPAARARGIRRERYYHPAARSLTDGTEEAKRLLAESNREGLLVEAVLPGLAEADIGDTASLPDEAIREPLYVSGLCYRIGSGGIFTRLLLQNRDYL